MNTQDARTPPYRSTGLDPDAADDLVGDDMAGTDDMDGMVDGDRQLTTDSDAIDGGLNDSDLGSPRPSGPDEGLGTDNATASNATV